MYYGMTALEKKLHDQYLEKESKKAFNEAWAKTKEQMAQGMTAQAKTIEDITSVKEGDVLVAYDWRRQGNALAIVDCILYEEHDSEIGVYFTTADELAKGLKPTGPMQLVPASYCKRYEPE